MSAKKIGAAGLLRAAKYSLLASTVLAGAVHAQAQDQPAANSGQIEEIVVTAQKRAENMQSVPISIQAFSGKKLEQMNATEFTDYAKFLPSVVFQSIAPSQTLIYMRGISIAGGADGNHSGPLPTVGLYLDEQPITTILGNLDIHLYDIERIEALAGPQGTLFGASSESGTLRIITNKPDTTGFHAGYNLELNTVHGDVGNIVESFVNVPLSDKVAIRLVGFEEIDGGYIDNVPGTLHFAGSDFTNNNRGTTENNFNGVTTYGGRAALGIHLDDDWTITPTIMGQDQRSTGVFGFDPKKGDLEVSRFYPDNNHDSWVQTALTIQGKIGDFDIVYSTGFFDRGLQSQADYSDYTAAYANAYGSSFSEGFLGKNGQPVNPTQRILGRDHFTKQTQELRISSPVEDRFHFVAGVFYERQAHKISQNYEISGLAASGSITGWPGTFWLTQQMRVDRDMAAYAQGTYEIDDAWSVDGGVRVFNAQNSLYGFYGFGPGNLYGSGTGENNPGCHIGQIFEDAPCAYLNRTVEEVNATFKATVTYKFDPSRLVYATASSGFRPGGVNRAGILPPYTSDTLYNYEFGWKTSWNNNEFRWNGALFWENWDNFQFAFLGLNSLTQIANAASATVRGLETDFTWAVDPNLTLSGSGSFINSSLDEPFCQRLTAPGCSNNPSAHPGTIAYGAPAGIPLPVTPAVKLNVTGRYEWDVSDSISAFVQSSLIFQGRSSPDLRVIDAGDLGSLPAYVSVDMSAGVTRDNTSASIFLKNAFDSRGELYRYSECSICQNQHYIVPITPLTFGVKFGQKF